MSNTAAVFSPNGNEDAMIFNADANYEPLEVSNNNNNHIKKPLKFYIISAITLCCG